MPKLAINGGTPVAPDRLKTTWPIIDDSDRKAVLRALNSGNWCRLNWADAANSEVKQFEEEFATYQDARHCLALANGTAAIEVALKAGEVGFGDEVIVPAVTFIASATAIIMAEAVPIFADIVPETFQIDPDSVESLITDRTKAIVAVHYGGYPADLDRLSKIAKKHNLLLVEDCAHAHGTEWRDRKVGAIGSIGAFSFQASKTLNCGEGGAVLSDDEKLIAKAFSYHHIGRIQGRPFYEHYIAAPNYRMTEFQGALLRSQLKKLPEQTQTRHNNGEYLASELGKIKGVYPLKRDARVTKHGYYFFIIRYIQEEFGGIPRDKFLQALNAEGVGAGNGYGVPLYKNPIFAENKFGKDGRSINWDAYGHMIDYSQVECPIADYALANEQVTFYNNYLLDLGNVEKIIQAIAKIRDNVAELR